MSSIWKGGSESSQPLLLAGKLSAPRNSAQALNSETGQWPWSPGGNLPSVWKSAFGRVSFCTSALHGPLFPHMDALATLLQAPPKALQVTRKWKSVPIIFLTRHVQGCPFALTRKSMIPGCNVRHWPTLPGTPSPVACRPSVFSEC